MLTFANEVAALEALKKDGATIGDTAISVKAFNPPPPRERPVKAAKAPAAKAAPAARAPAVAAKQSDFGVSIMNLPEDLSEEALVGIFEKYGCTGTSGVELNKKVG